MKITRDFSRGVAFMALGNWVEQAVNFAVFVTLARILGARDYGLLAMASVFVVMCEALVRESLSEYLIAAKEPQPEDLNATFWLLTGFGLVLALGLAGVSGLAAAAYGEDQVRWLILALAPSVVIVAMNAVPVALLRRAMNFKVLAIRAVAGAVLGGAVGIGMALAGFGVWSFVGQWLTMIGTNAAMAWLAADWRPGRAMGRKHLAGAARFGAQVLGMRLGELSAGQMATLVIGATLGAEATGLYAVAWKLIETLSFLLVTPLRQASQSAFAALLRQGTGAGDLLMDIASLSGAIAFPFFAGLALLAVPMVELVFGAGWQGAAPVLAVLAGMGVYLCIAKVQVAFCLAAGRAGAVALLLWITVGLIAVLIALASGGGLGAVAAAVMLAYLLPWPALFAVVARLAGVPALALAQVHLRPLAGAAVMAAVVWPVSRALGGQAPFVQLAAGTLSGVAVYLGFAQIFMHERFALFQRYFRGRQ